MSTKDDLVQVALAHVPVLGVTGGVVGCRCMNRVFVQHQETWAEHMADSILAALPAVEPEEVTTIEELDAMPEGSVVMETVAEPFLGIPTVAGVFHKFPIAVQEPGRTHDEGWRSWFVVAGHGPRPSSEISLPARVLWRPLPVEEVGDDE